MKPTKSDNVTSLTPPLGGRGVSWGVGRGVEMFYGAAPILFEFAKQMRNNPTEAESILWQYLSNNQRKGCRFKRQHPIKYFIADFYCHSKKIIIEIDGGYHQIPEQYEYDRNKDYELEELGLKVLHFTNEQVLFDIENTIRVIDEELTPHPLKGEKNTPKSPKGDLVSTMLQ